MKTQLLFTILLTAFFLKANSQWLFTASPSANDYCNSWQAVTLTINNPVAGNTYEWSHEDDYQFSQYGYSPTYVFDSGPIILVYVGYYAVCERIILTEYDAFHNAVNSDYITLGSNSGNIPYYYTYYNCGSITVLYAYTNFAIPSAGRWAMWFKDGVATGFSDHFIQEPDNGIYNYKLKLACGDTITTDLISVNTYPPKPVITASGSTTVCRLSSEGKDENAVDVKIFPNPSSDDFEIGMNDETIISNLMVFDVAGRLFETHNNILSGFKIGENWQPGVYNIQIVMGDLKMFKRVVKL